MLGKKIFISDSVQAKTGETLKSGTHRGNVEKWNAIASP